MYSFEVVGAGDATYDGTYIRSGYHNGQPLYTNGVRWLYWNISSWCLATGVELGNDYNSSGGPNPDSHLWDLGPDGVAPPPKVEDVGPWVVTGAGDGSYNGGYIRTGSYNGHSAYAHYDYTTGLFDRLLFHDNFSWILNPTQTLELGSFQGPYRGTLFDESLPSTWHVPLEGSGIEPAPTVEEYEGLYFPWWWLGDDTSDIPIWRQVASNYAGDRLIACVSSSPFFDTGDVFLSTNYGVSWSSIRPLWYHSYFSVALDSGGSHVIVGGARLYTSSNYGADWTERQPAGDADLSWLAVASDNDGSNLMAAASGGRLYTSSDSGANWTERQPGGAVNLTWTALDSDNDGSNLIAAATGGRLYTSSDSGLNWTERQPGGNADLNWSSVASDDDGSNLIACVFDGRLYTSANSGVDWSEPQPAGTSNEHWTCVSSDADGSYLVAGIRAGNLYSSSNSGSTWGVLTIPGAPSPDWNSVASSSGGDVIVCDAGTAGFGPFIGHTQTGLYVSWDGGVHWPTYSYKGMSDLELYGQGVASFSTNIAAHGNAALELSGHGLASFSTSVVTHGAASFSIGSKGVIETYHPVNGYWFRDLAGTWINVDGLYAPVLPHVGSTIFKDVSVLVLPKVADGFSVKLAILNRSLVPGTPPNPADYSEITYDIPAMVHVKLEFSMTVDGVLEDVHYSKILILSPSGTWVDRTFLFGPADAWLPSINETLAGHTVTTAQLLRTRVDFQPNYREWHKSGYTNPRMNALLAGGDWWSTAMGSWHIGDGNTWCSQASILNIDSLRLFYA